MKHQLWCDFREPVYVALLVGNILLSLYIVVHELTGGGI